MYKDIEKRKLYRKKYRIKNAIKLKLQRKKWDKKYLAKPTTQNRINNWMLSYYYKHKEDWLERVRRWQSSNKDKVWENSKKGRKERKIRILKNGGKFSKREWEDIKGKYNNCCACCKGKKELTIDHIIPLVFGGRHEYQNIQPLCRNCNSSKYTKIIKY